MILPAVVIIVPLLAALAMAVGPRPAARRWLLPGAAAPALLYSILGDKDAAAVGSWFLLETHLGLAYSGPVFLFLTGALWMLAGWFAAGYLKEDRAVRRFFLFWLITLSGNVGLVLAGDVPTFYTFFAVMTYAAYGLVAHTATPESWRAGRIYIVMAVLAEGMLVGALLMAVAGADSYLLADAAAAVAISEQRELIIALSVAGFGVKAGIVPLHFWLPLAHPVAPAPASAVLSGVMIKAGVLGWLHLLPGGHGDFPGWGAALFGVGLISAGYGVVCGVCQREPKTVLAYSSVSQIGVLLAIAGAGMAAGGHWEMTLTGIGIYALNHGLSKGALFLGAGVCSERAGAGAGERRYILAGLAVPTLAICGSPLLGGAVAKDAVKAAGGEWMAVALPVSSVLTSVLLGHFFLLARRQLFKRGAGGETAPGGGLLLPWLVSVAVSVLAVHWAVAWFGLEIAKGAGTWSSVWPILAGVGILAAAVYAGRRVRLRAGVPPGDLVVLLEQAVRAVRRQFGGIAGPERWRINFVPTVERAVQSGAVRGAMDKGEAVLRRQEVAAILIVLISLILTVLLWWG